MADYYPLLVRALDGLTENGFDERGAVYDRARSALLEQLRSVHPPLSETDIARERLALDDAIDRVEEEAARAVLAKLSPARGEPPRTGEGKPDPPGRRRAGLLARPQETGPSGAAGRERPRVDSISPSIGRARGGNTILIGAVLLVVVAAIAVAAWFLRDQPGAWPSAASPAAEAPAAPSVALAPPADADAKFSDRVSGGGRPAQIAAPAARNAAPLPPRGEVAVSQRAVMMEENPADPKSPKVSAGRGVWRIENLNAGQGQPLETAIRAELEVPDANLAVTLQIRRNLDPTLPASHTVLLTFRPDPANPDRVIKDIGLLQFKNEEAVRGTPVAGLPVPVKENVFLIGLSDLRGDVERNIELITRRNWIDLPIRMVKGQRAILSFEKGVSGEQVVNDALRQWGQL